MTFETINYTVTDGVAVIALNRPNDGNAITAGLARDLHNAAIAADEDSDVRAVILTGTGKMFCAGGDLKDFGGKGDDLSAYLKQTTTHLHGAISRFNWMDAPVICAINGVAAGGGLSLALAPDLAIAARSAKFTMAYTKAGLSPDGSSSYFLARTIGLRRAKEMALLNPVLSAEQAKDWGLINHVVDDEDLMDTAMAMAQKLAAGPTTAFGETKRLILGGMTESLESQMEREARTIAATASSFNGREGIAAFIAKRKPQFRS